MMVMRNFYLYLPCRKSSEPSSIYMSCSVSCMLRRVKNKISYSEAKGQSNLQLYPIKKFVLSFYILLASKFHVKPLLLQNSTIFQVQFSFEEPRCVIAFPTFKFTHDTGALCLNGRKNGKEISCLIQIYRKSKMGKFSLLPVIAVCCLFYFVFAHFFFLIDKLKRTTESKILADTGQFTHSML